MTRETRTLIARRRLGEVGDRAFVDWAVSVLEAGHDNEPLRRLAGFGPNPDRQEVEACFRQALGELGWDVPTPEQAVRLYAQDIAQEILDGTVAPPEGAHRLYQIYRDMNFLTGMGGWLYLNIGVDPDTQEKLGKGDWEAAAYREARRFVGLEARPIRPNPTQRLTSVADESGLRDRLRNWLGRLRGR